MNLYYINRETDDIRVHILGQYLYISRIEEVGLSGIEGLEPVVNLYTAKPGQALTEGERGFVVTDTLTINLENLGADNEIEVFNAVYAVREGQYNIFPETINIMRNSYPSKLSYKGTLTQIASNDPICKIYKEFKDTNINDISIEFYTNVNAVQSIVADGQTVTEILEPIQNRQPRFEITSPDTVVVDGTIELTAQLIDYTGAAIQKAGIQVYIKTNMGYLPYNKLLTDANGQVTFKFKAMDLAAEDTASLKFGFEYYSAVTIKDIMVTA